MLVAKPLPSGCLMLTRYKNACRKGVSEIVAVVLLTLIVVSVGSIVVYEAMKRSGTARLTLAGQIQKVRELEQQAPFNVIYACYNTTAHELVLLVNVGPGLLIISSIYINDTLVNTPDTSVTVNGSPVNDPQQIRVPELDVSVVRVQKEMQITPGDTLIVKVVTSTGISSTVVGVAVE